MTDINLSKIIDLRAKLYTMRGRVFCNYIIPIEMYIEISVEIVVSFLLLCNVKNYKHACKTISAHDVHGALENLKSDQLMNAVAIQALL